MYVLPAPVGACTTTSFPSRRRFTASCCHLSGMIRLTIAGNQFWVLSFGFWVLGVAPHRSVAFKCAHAKPKTQNPKLKTPQKSARGRDVPTAGAFLWIKCAKQSKEDGPGCHFLSIGANASCPQLPNHLGDRKGREVGIPVAIRDTGFIRGRSECKFA